jgi:hypothetical protein
MTEILGIFGGTGAVILGIGGCIWGIIKKYNVSCIRGKSIKNVPSITLPHAWEVPDNEEIEKPCNRMVFAKINQQKQWKLDMKDGSVYIFKDIFNATPSKSHYMRIKLQNVPENATIHFTQKFWKGTAKEYIPHENHLHRSIPVQPCDGVHTFYEPCLIGKDGITKEQLGVHFSGNFTDTILAEAYLGYDSVGICSWNCCRKNWCTAFYQKTKE